MRASQIKMSQTPKKNRPSDADAAMMADIQCGIQFFNDEKLDGGEKAEKQAGPTNHDPEDPPQHNQSFMAHSFDPMNMSFSFAVEAPIEMEQKHKLIG